MYPITQNALESFKTNAKQSANISIVTTNGTISVTEANLFGLTINRTSVSGTKIEIGSVISSEIELVLDNKLGTFNDDVFEGAEMYVQIGGQSGMGDVYYIPMGYFTIDEAPRLLDRITLKALDRMCLFDKYVDYSTLSFPCTMNTLLSDICSVCNISLHESYSGLPNMSKVVNAFSEDELTYRQILSWICEASGTCAYIDWNGKLRLEWYHETTLSHDTNAYKTLTESDRYSSDLFEQSIQVTGIKFGETLTGTDGYVFSIEDNPLLDKTFLIPILNAVSLLSYTPFEANTLPLPHLYPLDIIYFVKGGVSYTAIITSWTFKLGIGTSLSGVGETATNNGYASANPLTSREKTIISNLKKDINETLNARIQDVLELNDLIANTMGFWKTIQTLSDNSKILYIHDKPDLSESTNVWRMSGQVFTWTDNYQATPVVWNYGIDTGGNAWFKYVSAIGIQLSDPNTDWNSQFTPTAWFIKKGSMYAMQVDTSSGEVQMKIPKLVIDNPGTAEKDGYIEVGKVRIQPFLVSGNCVGTGIAEVD